MSDEIKQAIIAFMTKSTKKKLPIKDVTKALKDHEKKDVKNAIKAMTIDESLFYWSSGSTVYIMLPEHFNALEE
jgi:chemotaxis methyl-accepting protein methylase